MTLANRFSGLIFILVLSVVYIFYGCSTEEEGTLSSCEILAVSYSEDITPILESKCSVPACHDIAFAYGDFTQYDDLKEKADNGRLWLRIVTSGSMPPAGNPQLTESELERFKCWIEDGALRN
ncbi:MAG: hypothetical protein KJO50_10935 [Bacteroidia bacterium]|nr:hypothetical protein [Bacteroidia bacterium]NNF36088.1 hypothetical protein [Saprospiraceae bacterium]